MTFTNRITTERQTIAKETTLLTLHINHVMFIPVASFISGRIIHSWTCPGFLNGTVTWLTRPQLSKSNATTSHTSPSSSWYVQSALHHMNKCLTMTSNQGQYVIARTTPGNEDSYHWDRYHFTNERFPDDGQPITSQNIRTKLDVQITNVVDTLFQCCDEELLPFLNQRLNNKQSCWHNAVVISNYHSGIKRRRLPP